jgi:hypothetical protein
VPQVPKFVVRVDAVVNNKLSRMYSLVQSCTTTCFEENRGTINRIADSWTVRKQK